MYKGLFLNDLEMTVSYDNLECIWMEFYVELLNFS